MMLVLWVANMLQHPGGAYLISRSVHGPGGQRVRVGGRK